MIETVISAAFWMVFSFLALSALVLLLRTANRSSELARAFRSIDDQATNPESVSNKACEISEDSAALGTLAYVFLLPVLAAIFVAGFSTTVLQAFVAIAMSSSVLYASVFMKGRQDEFYDSFLQCVGRSVQEVNGYTDAHDHYPILDPRPRRSSRSSR